MKYTNEEATLLIPLALKVRNYIASPFDIELTAEDIKNVCDDPKKYSELSENAQKSFIFFAITGVSDIALGLHAAAVERMITMSGEQNKTVH